jgi:hypothetical protein
MSLFLSLGECLQFVISADRRGWPLSLSSSIYANLLKAEGVFPKNPASTAFRGPLVTL